VTEHVPLTAGEAGPLESGLRATPTAASRLLMVLVIGVLCVLTLLFAWRVSAHVAYPYPLDNGEGVALNSMWLSAQQKPFYGEITDPPYVFTVYNPLMIYLGGLSMRLLGVCPMGPRLVAAAFHLGLSAVVFLFVRRETKILSAGLVAALFILVERHLFSRAGYAVVDYSAIFFSILGLYLWRGGGRGRFWALGAFTLAFFSKQTSLMAAAACFAALFLEGRRGASVLFFLGFLALVAGGLAICRGLYGPAYFLNAYSYISTAPVVLKHSLVRTAIVIVLYVVPFAAAVRWSRQVRHNRRLILPTAYLFFALLLTLTSGKIGASRSYFFDLACALSIFVGLLWAKFVLTSRAGKLTGAMVVGVVLQLFLTCVGTLYHLSPSGDLSEAGLQRDRKISRVYEESCGLVLTRDHGFGLGTNSQNLGSDLYQLTLMIEANRFPLDLCTAPLKNGSVSTVIMPEEEGSWVLFGPELRELVKKNYRPLRSFGCETVYVPKTGEKAGRIER